MKSEKKKKMMISASGKPAPGRLAHEIEGGASGAFAGAVVGAAAGPPGILAGTIIGGLAGAIAGAGLDTAASQQSTRTSVLDAEIGISGGDLGAPNLAHPPARVGAYSAASAGAGSSSGEEPAEGPMQVPES